MDSPSINRRKFLRLAGVAGAGVLAADSLLWEPNRPRVVRRDVTLSRWPQLLDGFTIAVLSDFHYDPYFSIHPLHAAVGMVNSLSPDLIVLNGDFVTASLFHEGDRKAAAAAEPCAQLLSQMRAACGLWAVLGNHDFSTDPRHVTSALQARGIEVLGNRSVEIARNGARFWLCGVHDVLSLTADLERALEVVPRGDATVLLAHEPDYADYVARYPVDLQLSGHSHGGQVRLPFLRPLYLPALARKYVWGLYRIGELTLYTNPGLGTVGLPVRFNCPPEITLLSLHWSGAIKRHPERGPLANDGGKVAANKAAPGATHFT